MDVVAQVTPGWTLVELCELISKTLLGDHARDLHDSPEVEGSSLLVLPAWSWVEPDRSLGRKQRTGTLFPVRVHWDGPTVRLTEPGATVQLHWCIDGLGVADDGSCVIEPDLDRGLRLLDGTLPPNIDAAPVGVGGPGNAVSDLHRVIADGDHAHWEMMQLLERATSVALERAHFGLVADYSQQVFGDPAAASGPLLHPETLETLRFQMVYGSGDEDPAKDPPMTRVLRDMHAPGTFTNVEPQRWLRVRIGKLARDWVARAAGDPNEGPRIRRAARELGGDPDPEQLSTTLGIGMKRVKAALSLSPNPDAAGVPFDPHHGVDTTLVGGRTRRRP